MSEIATEIIELKPVPAELATGASRALTYARSIVVESDDDYEIAANEVKDFKSRWKHIDAVRVFFVDPLNKAVKKYNDAFRQSLSDLDEAEEVVEKKMIVYRKQQAEKAEEERKAREEAIRKAQLEAERKAREEQAKLEAEARIKREAEERQRLEAERTEREAREAREREIEAKRRGDREAQAKAKEEAERLEQERREHEAAERKAREEAEKREEAARNRPAEILDQAAAEAAAQPMLVISAPTASGTAARKKWRCEVFDKLALVRAVAAQTVPLSVLDVPEGPLNRAANALQGELNYPGVRCIPEESLAFSSRK